MDAPYHPKGRFHVFLVVVDLWVRGLPLGRPWPSAMEVNLLLNEGTPLKGTLPWVPGYRG